MCRAPPASECCCEWLKSYEHCYLPLACVRPTVLSSADRVPPRAGRADARTHEAQAAEAAGQRTARGRLLRRVGPPVQLPLVQKMRERHEWQCTAFGRWTLARDAERCSATRTK